MGGTTMGGTTMDNATMGGTTMGPEATGFESFDPEALKREATQLAQESLEDAGIQQPAAETSLGDTPADTPQEALQTPTEVPVSQMTEAPVSVLPDTGGPKIWVFGALVLITGLAGMAAFDRVTARAPSVKDEDGAGSDDGLGR